MSKQEKSTYTTYTAGFLKQMSFKESNWLRFKRNKRAYCAYKLLLLIIVIAVLSPFIATDLPWYCNYKGTKMYPAFSLSNACEIKNPVTNMVERIQYDITDWKHLNAEKIIFAPIPYNADKTDYANSNYLSPGSKQTFITTNGQAIKMPLRFRHWLGTNKRGEDVLSGLINGTRISLMVGIISMAIASFIGILLGALAGYFGNTKAGITRGALFMSITGLVFAYYYGFYIRHYQLTDGLAASNFEFFKELLVSLFICSCVLLLFYYLKRIMNRLHFFKKQIHLPVDAFISRAIEVLVSLPLLILIISIAVILKENSVINTIFIIGFTFWAGIARLTRAEFLKIATLDYIQSAKAMGFKESRIIIKHALPNALVPVMVAMAFGVAAAILIESSLSFLGVGTSAGTVTWGSLLNSGREQYTAWWLVVFPGMAIFVTVLVFNFLAEGVRSAFDPRAE